MSEEPRVIDTRFTFHLLMGWAWWAVCCLCSIPVHVNGQATFSVQHFSLEHGITDHRTTDILEHSNGFVYVSTWNGCNRFDGYRFTPLPHTDRPIMARYAAGNFCWRLRESTDGRIVMFMGDMEQTPTVVDVFDPRSQTVFGDTIFSERQVGARLEIELGRETLYLLPQHIKRDSAGIFSDSQGNVLQTSGIDSSACVLHLSDGEAIDLSEAWNELKSIRPRPNCADFSRYIYCSSYNGLVRINIQSLPFSTALSDPEKQWEYGQSARASYELPNGTLLLSTETTPLATWNLDNGFVTVVPSDSTTKTGKGLERFARSIYRRDATSVWLTRYDATMEAFDWQTSERKYFRLGNTVKTSFLASCQWEGHIALGAHHMSKHNELLAFDPSDESYRSFPNISQGLRLTTRITAMESIDSHIWIGTTEGLFEVDPHRDEILRVWTSDQFADRFEALETRPQPLLPTGAILSLCWHANTLLIGTEGKGLMGATLDGKNLFWLTQANGLPNDIVCSITPDNSGFWIGTYNGLAHYQPSTGVVQHYTVRDGMPHNECNRFSNLRLSDGRILIGGMNGFGVFEPRDLLKQGEYSTLILAGCSVYNEALEQFEYTAFHAGPPQEIDIPARTRSCSFEIGLVDHWRADETEYFYNLQLDGKPFDDAMWRSNGTRRSVEFEYLDAGEHILHFRAVMADGRNSKSAFVRLDVAELFWKTWWFMLVVALGIVGISFAVYRYRLQQVLKIERLKTQLSNDLHDDVGSVLSGVAYQMELLEMTVAPEHQSRVQRVAQSSRKAMWQMRDVVWAINQSNASLHELQLRMKEFAQEQLEPLGIAATFQVNKELSDRKISSEARHALLMIFKEFVTNSIKHANASTIAAAFHKEGRQLVMQLRDNGQGLPDSLPPHTGQGLDNMKRRARALGGTADFLNQSGLTLTIRIPLP